MQPEARSKVKDQCDNLLKVIGEMLTILNSLLQRKKTISIENKIKAGRQRNVDTEELNEKNKCIARLEKVKMIVKALGNIVASDLI